MDDTTLDQRLRNSAPNPTPPLGLSEHSARILDEARSRRKTRTRRVWLGSAAAFLIFGGGTAALAGNDLVTPWGWTADSAYIHESTSGTTCYMGILIKHEGVSENSDVVKAAKDIIGGLDPASMDTTEMEKFLSQEYANADNGPHVATRDELKQQAVFRQVADTVWANLEKQGFDAQKIGVYSTSESCTP